MKLQEENVRFSADLDASEFKVNHLESQIELASSKYDIKEAENRQCLDELDRVTTESKKISAELSNVKVNLEESIKKVSEDALVLNETIASSNAQFSQLKAQICTLT